MCDFSSWDPEPAGSHPSGASAWGVEDLVGNGWEWTGTVFGPFPGFQPMPTELKAVLGLTGLFNLLFFVYPAPLVNAASAAARSLF